MQYIFLFMSIVFFSACATTKSPLSTVQEVNVNRYLGTWHEIARYEHFFEEECIDVSAIYTLKENGEIAVVNRCTKNGELSEAIGQAYATDTTNSKLKVSFFWPFYGDYWIVMLGNNYEYAVIGEPSREYFWILSRTKVLDKNIQENILSKLPSLGYEESKIIWTKQTK